MQDTTKSEYELKNKVSEFYKSQSNTYNDIEDFSYWKILYSEYNKWIKNNLSNTSLANIVELGCGTGLLTELLSKSKANRIYAIDLCKQFLKIAITASNSHHYSERFFPCHGDIASIPFKDNFVDALVCLNTFDHIHNIEGAISEIRRICKKDGSFIFDITSSMTLEPWPLFGYYGIDGFKFVFNRFLQNTVPYNWSIETDNNTIQEIKTYRHSPKYVEKLLGHYGFEIINKKGVHLCNAVIPERIQANSASKFLSKINKACHSADKLLNKIPFLQNHFMYVMYSCKLLK